MFDFLIFRVDKDVSPSCGVEDYVNTWNDFYDAANLKETYNFLSPQSSSASYGQASFAGRQGLREISPANLTVRPAWSPLADDYHIDSIKARSDNPTSSTTTTSSVIRGLTVSTLPPVMEYRVCELTSGLRSSLSCLSDNSLQESRVLQDCIDNIERVSSVRLDVTQKIIDISLELDNLEIQEY